MLKERKFSLPILVAAMLLSSAVSSLFTVQFVQAGTEMQLADVPSNHWAYNAVQSATSKGLLAGFPDKTFQGNRGITRYETAKIVTNLTDYLQKREDVLIKSAPNAQKVQELEKKLEQKILELQEELDSL